MSTPNQYIVKIAPRELFDKAHTYSLMHLDSLQKAMCNLKGESLKLWLYCNKNQDGYQFDLSQKKVQDWGLRKDAYQSAKRRLLELGYLVPISEGSNILMFYENPQLSEKPTIGTLSEKQIVAGNEESEKPTIGEAKMSEKPTELSGNQTILSEKPQRNNTIIHNSTIKDSTVADSEEPENYNEIPVNQKDDSVQTDFKSPVYTQYNNIRKQDNKQDNDSGLAEKETKGWSQWEDFVF